MIRTLATITLGVGTLASSTATARPRRCKEVSSVVGYERCSRFGGRWSVPDWVPAFSLDLGFVAHRFAAEPIDAGLPSRNTAMRRVDAPPATTMTALALALSMKATIRGRFYTGPEIEFGGLVAGPPHWNDAGPNGPIPSAPFFAARWVAGVRSGSEPLMVAAELAGGVRAFGFVTDARASDAFVFQERAVLEGRVRASYWVHPWIAVGASFGTSLVDRGDVSVGLFVAAYSRTFAGRQPSGVLSERSGSGGSITTARSSQ